MRNIKVDRQKLHTKLVAIKLTITEYNHLAEIAVDDLVTVAVAGRRAIVTFLKSHQDKPDD